MIYSKTLNTETDYNDFTGTKHATAIRDLLNQHNVTSRFEHEHRAFEYGLVFDALKENNAEQILDVGGGGSVFDAMCAWVDMDVTVVDPGDCSNWVDAQNAVLKDKPDIKYVQQNFFDYSDRNKYDAVTCISTIEHVGSEKADDTEVPIYETYDGRIVMPVETKDAYWDLFHMMLAKVRKGGLFALTTDFHPSGKKQVDGHVRTYNKEMMLEFIDNAVYNAKRGSYKFKVYGDGYDYDHFAPDVNNYTFASLVLKRVK